MPVQMNLADPPSGGKRARTRKALIEAATEVVAEKGFDRASFEEVARRAGMTRGAVYLARKAQADGQGPIMGNA